jgi:2,3-bisphosphoglycerate-dependent phosphoglycerate mutase
MNGENTLLHFRYFYGMKKILVIILLSFLLPGIPAVQAQSKTTTIIVLRHAEKDTSKSGSQMMQADPFLSETGKARAQNLVTTLKEFAPSAVYSTNYNRTKYTVTPLADKLGLEIQLYDPAKQQALVDKIKGLEGQTIVVVGHSNTAPRLVNLLASTTYSDLQDSVYDQLYIVKITDGVATVEVRKY